MKYKKLILAEIVLALLFFLLKNCFLGVSFLFVLAGCVCILALIFTLCCLPFQSRVKNIFCSFLKTFIITFVVLGVISFAVVERRIYLSSSGDADQECDFVIVLGAGVYGTVPSATLKSRIDRAYEYMNKYRSTIAVLSGGQGKREDISEAEAMKRYLIDKGIDQSRLYLEDNSSSTAENIEYSLKILEQLTDKRPISAAIISNDFHLFRSKRLALSQNIDAKVFGTPVPNVGLVPLSCWVREYFSVMFMYAREII